MIMKLRKTQWWLLVLSPNGMNLITVTAVAAVAASPTIFGKNAPNSEADAEAESSNCSNNYSGDFAVGQA